MSAAPNPPTHHSTNSPVFFGALGDIHGAFDAARRIVARHPDIPFWLCVGDIASDAGQYEPLGSRIYWIHGNNDNFDAIASGRLPPDLYHIDNGSMVSIYVGGVEQITVAGLGGTFAPTWYDTPAAELPYPGRAAMPGTSAPAARARRRSGAPPRGAAERAASGRATPRAVKDDKRRHFVREDVEACLALRGMVDVFLTHEAPKPFRPYPGGRGPDAGKLQINEILAAMRPRLHLFGHHHRFSEQTVEGVPSVGLDLVTRSYLLVHATTFAYELATID